jgi:hypothetical protein
VARKILKAFGCVVSIHTSCCDVIDAGDDVTNFKKAVRESIGCNA